MIATRNGKSKEVGQFALHVQCHYEFTTRGGDKGGPEVMSFPLSVSSIRETPIGALLTDFDNGGSLQVLPDLRASSDPEEQWRFFRPNTGDKHMVFLSSGRYL